MSGVAGAWRIWWVFPVLAALVACAPEYTKPDDLFRKLDAGKAERPFANAKACVLFTENTSRALEYVGGIHSLPGSQAGTDPKGIVSDMVDVLDSRFRETGRIQSMDETGFRQCNVVIAIDLKLELAWYTLQSNIATIDAVVFDANRTQLDTISAQGKGIAIAGNTGFRPVWTQALASLGKGLDSSSRLAQYAASVPAPSTAVAAAPAANIDLAFWDSMKGSTNPADFQAYLQKFPNGSFTALARTRLSSLGEAVPVRLVPLALPAGGKVNFGTYHALVIGIDRYREVTPLRTAVNDAKTVADLLQKEYGFHTTLLVDATRNQILDAFDDLRRRLTEQDNLLIYYAGHGHLDSDSDRGFWLPVDANRDRRANWLSNSDIADVVRATRAKHVLVVADSCYAGTLTRSLSVQLSALDDFSRLAEKRARTALVSGGLEPVEDAGGGGHSVFAKAFLDSLLTNTGVVDMSQIFSSMRRQVILSAQQTPQYGDIRQTGHEGGDFIFVRRPASRAN